MQPWTGARSVAAGTPDHPPNVPPFLRLPAESVLQNTACTGLCNTPPACVDAFNTPETCGPDTCTDCPGTDGCRAGTCELILHHCSACLAGVIFEPHSQPTPHLRVHMPFAGCESTLGNSCDYPRRPCCPGLACDKSATCECGRPHTRVRPHIHLLHSSCLCRQAS